MVRVRSGGGPTVNLSPCSLQGQLPSPDQRARHRGQESHRVAHPSKLPVCLRTTHDTWGWGFDASVYPRYQGNWTSCYQWSSGWLSCAREVVNYPGPGFLVAPTPPQRTLPGTQRGALPWLRPRARYRQNRTRSASAEPGKRFSAPPAGRRGLCSCFWPN